MKKLYGIILALLLLPSVCFASKQVWLGNSADANIDDANYYQLSGHWGSTTEANGSTYVSTSGTISSLFVEVASTPGAGNSRTFTINKNGVAQSLTCTINNPDTACSDISNSFSVVANDYVSLDPSSSGTPTVAIGQWSALFDGSTTKESTYSSSTNNLSQTALQYIAPHSNATVSTTEKARVLMCSTSGTFKNFYVNLSSAPSGSASRTFTLRKNSATPAGAPTCTVSGTATTCSDLVNTMTVVAGDMVSIMSEVATTPAVAQERGSVTFTADTDGEFLIGAVSGTLFTNNITEYFNLWSGNFTANATETTIYQLANAFTISDMYVELGANPGAGNSYNFTFRQNTATPSGSLTCQIAGGTATTCNDTVNSVVISNSDNLDTMQVPTSLPTARVGRIGYLGYIAPSVTRRMWTF